MFGKTPDNLMQINLDRFHLLLNECNLSLDDILGNWIYSRREVKERAINFCTDRVFE